MGNEGLNKIKIIIPDRCQEILKNTPITQGKTQIGRIVLREPTTIAINKQRQIARKELDSSQQTLSHRSRAIKRTCGSSTMEVVSDKKPRRTETDKDQWIRTVQKESVPRQIARKELDSSQQTLSHRSRAIKRTCGSSTMEVVSAKKPRRTETDEYQWIETFKNKVRSAIQELNEERKHTPDDLLFCLKIVETIGTLRELLKKEHIKLAATDYQNCKRYVMSETAPLYNAVLGPALKILQNRIDNEGGWTCFPDLRTITRYLRNFSDQDNLDQAHKEMLRKLWIKHLSGELNYFKYLRNIPNNKNFVELTLKNINWLLYNKKSPILRFKFMAPDEIENFKDMVREIHGETVGHNINNRDAGERKRNRDKLIETSSHENEIKRVGHDNLLIRFEEFKNQFKNTGSKELREQSVMWRCTDFLEKLSELHDENKNLVGNRPTLLRQKLKIEILLTVNKIHDEIKKHKNDEPQLKEKALRLIQHLKEDGYLDEQCRTYYPGSIQSQDIVRHNISMEEMSYTKYNMFIHSLFFKYNANPSFSEIANELKELYQHKLDLITKDNCGKLKHRMDVLINLLYKDHIQPVFDAYDHAKRGQKSPREAVAAEMSKYKDTFIELIGREFILNENKRPLWKHMACLAWSNDIDQLCGKSSFSESDVDNLLHLKCVVPDPLDEYIKNRFQAALTNILMEMRLSDPNAALTEKVMKLSKWVEDLSKQHRLDSTLYDMNEKWQKWQNWKKENSESKYPFSSVAKRPLIKL